MYKINLKIFASADSREYCYLRKLTIFSIVRLRLFIEVKNISIAQSHLSEEFLCINYLEKRLRTMNNIISTSMEMKTQSKICRYTCIWNSKH